MKTDLKKKVERLHNYFWILFFIIFALDFITTNLSIHVFGLPESNAFLRNTIQVFNPFIYLAFFILVLLYAFGGGGPNTGGRRESRYMDGRARRSSRSSRRWCPSHYR